MLKKTCLQGFSLWAFFISFFCVVKRRLKIGTGKRLGKVISCFAGIGCGELGLKRQNIAVDSVYAYEIDKYAESVNRYHNPDTVFLGDITKWKEHTETIGRDVDLIMGGSPCQDLSIAGKRVGLDGARSGLFWTFVEMIKHYKPKYFLLENVASMSGKDKDIITEAMGVEPVMINAALVSAQQRKRLFWTNLPYTSLKDKRIFVKDILLDKEQQLKAIFKSLRLHKIETGICMNYPKRLGEMDDRKSQNYRVYSVYGKAPTLNAKHIGSDAKFFCDGCLIRLNPIECERLQTLEDDYTKYGMSDEGLQEISNTQRYKMVGNGWCVDAVAEAFFKNI